ncbi:MAG TPA: hypothetical protein VMT63_13205 [Bacteroidales bacterium]|nr:hypothetical protein [Bacteroidales bacterium]
MELFGLSDCLLLKNSATINKNLALLMPENKADSPDPENNGDLMGVSA